MNNVLVDLIKLHMSGLACERRSGFCESISCSECRARTLASVLMGSCGDVTVIEWKPVGEFPEFDDTFTADSHVLAVNDGGVTMTWQARVLRDHPEWFTKWARLR